VLFLDGRDAEAVVRFVKNREAARLASEKALEPGGAT